eukprot:511923-Rhodomonas_salina.1
MVFCFLSPALGSSITPSVNSALSSFGFHCTHAVALAAFGISSSTADTYFINSGCTRTICCNSHYARNLRQIEQVTRKVKGLTGYQSYDLACDLYVPLLSENGTIETLIVNSALFDPTSNINLIASEDVNKSNWDVNF